jgi:hypothetical protein
VLCFYLKATSFWWHGHNNAMPANLWLRSQSHSMLQQLSGCSDCAALQVTSIAEHAARRAADEAQQQQKQLMQQAGG